MYRYIDDYHGVELVDTPTHLSLTFNPTKFWKGHNWQMIGRDELEQVKYKLNELYCIDVGEWTVSGFDFNFNLQTKYRPAIYFPLFGYLQRIGQQQVYMCKRTGITYSNQSNTKAVTLYNLHLRKKKEKEPIPPEFEGLYILRVEISVNSKINQIALLRDMQTFEDYLNPGNYAKLPQLLFQMYEKIEKEEPMPYVPNLKKAERDMIAAIRMHSLNGYRNQLRHQYPKNYSYYCKRIDVVLEKVRNEQRKNGTLSLIDELNQKVKEQVHRSQECCNLALAA